MRHLRAAERGRLRLLVDVIAGKWTHPYDQWCVRLFLATTAAEDTYQQVKRDRRVSREKWKEDIEEGRRLIKEGLVSGWALVRKSGVLDEKQLRAMLAYRPPPEW